MSDRTRESGEFDKYAREYKAILNESVKISGFTASYFAERKIKEIFNFLKARELEDKPLSFLNFGCGVGESECFIAKYLRYTTIYSVDVSAESIEIARENNSKLKNAFFSTFDGYHVPFETNFDVILIANVLHHIQPENHVTILKLLCRRLNKEGYIFIFEHNPFNPLTIKTVKSCRMDENAILLKPSYTGEILSESGFTWREMRFFLFFPRLLNFLIPLEKFLKKLPLGAQYYFIARKD